MNKPGNLLPMFPVHRVTYDAGRTPRVIHSDGRYWLPPSPRAHYARTAIWIGPSARPWMNWSTRSSPERVISLTGPAQMIRPW
jgi:hypothetical protein